MPDKPDWADVQQTQLFSGTIAPGSASPQLPIGSFQSLLVTIESSGAGALPVAIVNQVDASGNNCDSRVIGGDTVTAFVPFAIPIKGITAVIVNNSPIIQSYFVVATTAVIPDGPTIRARPAYELSAVLASGLAANTLTRLRDTYTDFGQTIEDTTYVPGSASYRLGLGALGGATRFTLYASIPDALGRRQFVAVNASVAATDLYFTAGHPASYVGWWIQNNATLTSAVQVVLDVIPAAS